MELKGEKMIERIKDIVFEVASYGHLTLLILQMLLGVRMLILPALILAQDAISPAIAERVGKLEVKVAALERQLISSATFHRADVATFTKEQQGLRDLVIAGQAETKIVWGVFAGILLFIAAASAWKTTWSRIRQWNGHLTEK